MRTPSLRRRVTLAGVGVLAVGLITFDLIVFVSMRVLLLDTLDEVLDERLTIASRLADDLEPDDLPDRLVVLGVPAALRSADGEVMLAEPAAPRVGVSGPAAPPTTLVHPRISRTVSLPDGTELTVFATRAGVDQALRALLSALGLGSAVVLVGAALMLRRATDGAMAPLGQVVATAESTAGGNLGQRLRPDDPTTELGRMAHAVDVMLDALEDAIGEAQHSAETTKRFLADAAHQLRTPLTTLRGTLELVLRETSPEQRDQLFASAVRETARASRLVSSLLRVARLEAGEEPRREPNDLVALCREEVERARSLAPHLTIDLDVTDAPTTAVPVNAADLQEALGNLLDNARRHASSRIDLRIAATTHEVTIELRDDGPGLPPGSEETVFARFTSLGAHGGSGLGLPIARGIARAHGGTLSYDDAAFALRLPRDHEPPGSTSP